MRRTSVQVGQRSISCLITEPQSSGPHRPASTAVFLHAFPLQASMWAPALDSLPDGWRGIAPDFRGFGESPLGDSSTYRIADLAGDVIDVLDRLEVTQAAIFGCSMGGYVLFEVLKSAPRYLSGIGLVSTRAGADTAESKANRQKMISKLDNEGTQAIADEMVPKLLGKQTQADRPDLVELVRGLALGNRKEGLKAAVHAMMERSDSTALLSHISVPVLIVHGTEDALIPPAEAEAMHRMIAGSSYVSMPSSGHLPSLERRNDFHSRVGEFLSKL